MNIKKFFMRKNKKTNKNKNKNTLVKRFLATFAMGVFSLSSIVTAAAATPGTSTASAAGGGFSVNNTVKNLFTTKDNYKNNNHSRLVGEQGLMLQQPEKFESADIAINNRFGKKVAFVDAKSFPGKGTFLVTGAREDTGDFKNNDWEPGLIFLDENGTSLPIGGSLTDHMLHLPLGGMAPSSINKKAYKFNISSFVTSKSGDYFTIMLRAHDVNDTNFSSKAKERTYILSYDYTNKLKAAKLVLSICLEDYLSKELAIPNVGLTNTGFVFGAKGNTLLRTTLGGGALVFSSSLGKVFFLKPQNNPQAPKYFETYDYSIDQPADYSDFVGKHTGVGKFATNDSVLTTEGNIVDRVDVQNSHFSNNFYVFSKSGFAFKINYNGTVDTGIYPFFPSKTIVPALAKSVTRNGRAIHQAFFNETGFYREMGKLNNTTGVNIIREEAENVFVVGISGTRTAPFPRGYHLKKFKNAFLIRAEIGEKEQIKNRVPLISNYFLGESAQKGKLPKDWWQFTKSTSTGPTDAGGGSQTLRNSSADKAGVLTTSLESNTNAFKVLNQWDTIFAALRGWTAAHDGNKWSNLSKDGSGNWVYDGRFTPTASSVFSQRNSFSDSTKLFDAAEILANLSIKYYRINSKYDLVWLGDDVMGYASVEDLSLHSIDDTNERHPSLIYRMFKPSLSAWKDDMPNSKPIKIVALSNSNYILLTGKKNKNKNVFFMSTDWHGFSQGTTVGSGAGSELKQLLDNNNDVTKTPFTTSTTVGGKKQKPWSMATGFNPDSKTSRLKFPAGTLNTLSWAVPSVDIFIESQSPKFGNIRLPFVPPHFMYYLNKDQFPGITAQEWLDMKASVNATHYNSGNFYDPDALNDLANNKNATPDPNVIYIGYLNDMTIKNIPLRYAKTLGFLSLKLVPYASYKRNGDIWSTKDYFSFVRSGQNRVSLKIGSTKQVISESNFDLSGVTTKSPALPGRQDGEIKNLKLSPFFSVFIADEGSKLKEVTSSTVNNLKSGAYIIKFVANNGYYFDIDPSENSASELDENNYYTYKTNLVKEIIKHIYISPSNTFINPNAGIDIHKITPPTIVGGANALIQLSDVPAHIHIEYVRKPAAGGTPPKGSWTRATTVKSISLASGKTKKVLEIINLSSGDYLFRKIIDRSSQAGKNETYFNGTTFSHESAITEISVPNSLYTGIAIPTITNADWKRNPAIFDNDAIGTFELKIPFNVANNYDFFIREKIASAKAVEFRLIQDKTDPTKFKLHENIDNTKEYELVVRAKQGFKFISGVSTVDFVLFSIAKTITNKLREINEDLQILSIEPPQTKGGFNGVIEVNAYDNTNKKLQYALFKKRVASTLTQVTSLVWKDFGDPNFAKGTKTIRVEGGKNKVAGIPTDPLYSGEYKFRWVAKNSGTVGAPIYGFLSPTSTLSFNVIPASLTKRKGIIDIPNSSVTSIADPDISKTQVRRPIFKGDLTGSLEKLDQIPNTYIQYRQTKDANNNAITGTGVGGKIKWLDVFSNTIPKLGPGTYEYRWVSYLSNAFFTTNNKNSKTSLVTTVIIQDSNLNKISGVTSSVHKIRRPSFVGAKDGVIEDIEAGANFELYFFPTGHTTKATGPGPSTSGTTVNNWKKQTRKANGHFDIGQPLQNKGLQGGRFYWIALKAKPGFALADKNGNPIQWLDPVEIEMKDSQYVGVAAPPAGDILNSLTVSSPLTTSHLGSLSTTLGAVLAKLTGNLNDYVVTIIEDNPTIKNPKKRRLVIDSTQTNTFKEILNLSPGNYIIRVEANKAIFKSFNVSSITQVDVKFTVNLSGITRVYPQNITSSGQTSPTTSTSNDGKISGLVIPPKFDLEYIEWDDLNNQPVAGASWIRITSVNLTGLKSGTYRFRWDVSAYPSVAFVERNPAGKEVIVQKAFPALSIIKVPPSNITIILKTPAITLPNDAKSTAESYIGRGDSVVTFNTSLLNSSFLVLEIELSKNNWVAVQTSKIFNVSAGTHKLRWRSLNGNKKFENRDPNNPSKKILESTREIGTINMPVSSVNPLRANPVMPTSTKVQSYIGATDGEIIGLPIHTSATLYYSTDPISTPAAAANWVAVPATNNIVGLSSGKIRFRWKSNFASKKFNYNNVLSQYSQEFIFDLPASNIKVISSGNVATVLAKTKMGLNVFTRHETSMGKKDGVIGIGADVTKAPFNLFDYFLVAHPTPTNKNPQPIPFRLKQKSNFLREMIGLDPNRYDIMIKPKSGNALDPANYSWTKNPLFPHGSLSISLSINASASAQILPLSLTFGTISLEKHDGFVNGTSASSGDASINNITLPSDADLEYRRQGTLAWILVVPKTPGGNSADITGLTNGKYEFRWKAHANKTFVLKMPNPNGVGKNVLTQMQYAKPLYGTDIITIAKSGIKIIPKAILSTLTASDFVVSSEGFTGSGDAEVKIKTLSKIKTSHFKLQLEISKGSWIDFPATGTYPATTVGKQSVSLYAGSYKMRWKSNNPNEKFMDGKGKLSDFSQTILTLIIPPSKTTIISGGTLQVTNIKSPTYQGGSDGSVEFQPGTASNLTLKAQYFDPKTNTFVDIPTVGGIPKITGLKSGVLRLRWISKVANSKFTIIDPKTGVASASVFSEEFEISISMSKYQLIAGFTPFNVQKQNETLTGKKDGVIEVVDKVNSLIAQTVNPDVVLTLISPSGTRRKFRDAKGKYAAFSLLPTGTYTVETAPRKGFIFDPKGNYSSFNAVFSNGKILQQISIKSSNSAQIYSIQFIYTQIIPEPYKGANQAGITGIQPLKNAILEYVVNTTGTPSGPGANWKPVPNSGASLQPFNLNGLAGNTTYEFRWKAKPGYTFIVKGRAVDVIAPLGNSFVKIDDSEWTKYPNLPTLNFNATTTKDPDYRGSRNGEINNIPMLLALSSKDFELQILIRGRFTTITKASIKQLAPGQYKFRLKLKNQNKKATGSTKYVIVDANGKASNFREYTKVFTINQSKNKVISGIIPSQIPIGINKATSKGASDGYFDKFNPAPKDSLGVTMVSLEFAPKPPTGKKISTAVWKPVIGGKTPLNLRKGDYIFRWVGINGYQFVKQDPNDPNKIVLEKYSDIETVFLPEENSIKAKFNSSSFEKALGTKNTLKRTPTGEVLFGSYKAEEGVEFFYRLKGQTALRKLPSTKGKALNSLKRLGSGVYELVVKPKKGYTFGLDTKTGQDKQYTFEVKIGNITKKPTVKNTWIPITIGVLASLIIILIISRIRVKKKKA